jgi:ADP-heptose:LPS heptosyltransferase
MRRFCFVHPINTIAVFRALQLGDLLCCVPALRMLRAGFPKAHITLIGLPWAHSFASRFSSYIDAFIEFPGWPGLPEQEMHLADIPGFLYAMQSHHFDLLLQMQGNGTITNPLISLFGARQAAGYYQPGSYCPNSEMFFPYPQEESEVRIFQQMLEQLGLPPQGEELEFPVHAEEQDKFELFRRAHDLVPGGYACLHPGARALERRWPVERFAAVGDWLDGMGLRVVITGSATEAALTRAVSDRMHAAAVDASGQTGLGELGLLISQARLLVCNDTGVSHIAAAMHTPSVILYSTSDPRRWRPLDHQLHRAVCDAARATTAQVTEEIAALLNETNQYASSTI